MDRRTLINWGSYDVDNFGDLLFPHIVEKKMQGHFDNIVHASPTGLDSRWSDALKTVPLLEAIDTSSQAVLLVGGGNLISWTKSSSINYREQAELAELVHPSFLYAPMILRARYGIPYVINRIGVSKPIPRERTRELKMALELAEYVSVRDRGSKSRLRMAGSSKDITVGIDSAFEIGDIFRKVDLLKHYHNHVRPRYRLTDSHRIATVHLKQRYLNADFSAVNGICQWLIDQGITPVLLPLGTCHGDDELVRHPALKLDQVLVVDFPQTLLDMLAILAVSDYYLGSSLHGAITSLSYGNKALLVADEARTRFTKFSGFLEQIGLSQYLVSDWIRAHDLLVTNGLTFLSPVADRSSHIAAVNDIWHSIRRRLTTTSIPKKPLNFSTELTDRIESLYRL